MGLGISRGASKEVNKLIDLAIKVITIDQKFTVYLKLLEGVFDVTCSGKNFGIR
jgi:hypothetical protein